MTRESVQDEYKRRVRSQRRRICPIEVEKISVRKFKAFAAIWNRKILAENTADDRLRVSAPAPRRGLKFTGHLLRTYAKMRGATIVASDSIIKRGVLPSNFPHVIFSFGTAPL